MLNSTTFGQLTKAVGTFLDRYLVGIALIIVVVVFVRRYPLPVLSLLIVAGLVIFYRAGLITWLQGGRIFNAHCGSVTSVAFAPDGKTVTSGNERGVFTWSLASKRVVHVTSEPAPATPSSALSSDGQWRAECRGNLVKVFGNADPKCIRTLRGHRGRVNTVGFSANGGWIASGGADGTVRIWPLRR